MDLPEWLTPDTVTLRMYEGAGVGGAVHGPPVTSRARVEYGRQYIRDKTGARVLTVARVWLPLDVGDVSPESLATLPNGREATVVTADRHEFGDATPNHTELRVR